MIGKTYWARMKAEKSRLRELQILVDHFVVYDDRTRSYRSVPAAEPISDLELKVLSGQ